MCQRLDQRGGIDDAGGFNLIGDENLLRSRLIFRRGGRGARTWISTWCKCSLRPLCCCNCVAGELVVAPGVNNMIESN
jgi:hypothetical protein